MFVPNTDLLPPLFDRVLELDEAEHRKPFAEKKVIDGARKRQDIMRGLETGILNAAATTWRRRARDTLVHQRPIDTPGDIRLSTSDRLSGADLSRAGLVVQLRDDTKLRTTVLELALLLIEAQIDLRLKGGGGFEFGDFKFASVEENKVDQAADWCKSILDPALRGALLDRGSRWRWPLSKGEPAGLRVLLETLQLSATVRDALPYVISIARHRVEGLVAEPSKVAVIRLLHVSDLHIVDDIATQGGRERKPFGVPSHSLDRASTVATAVRGLAPRYDMLVATGDLTAGGGRRSFETVLQYLQQGAVTGENPMRIATQGLAAGPSQRILLPGNHDRYADQVVLGQRLDSLFEEVLQTHQGYPYWVGYRPPREPDDVNALTLLFVVFDSTLPEGRKSDFPGDWVKAVAQGEIRGAETEEARLRVSGLLQPNLKVVPKVGGGELAFNPANTVRIALLHHHPIEKAPRPSDEPDAARGMFVALRDFLGFPARAKAELDASLMAMHGADDFLRGCFASGVQLVLFGHQHHPYQRLIKAEAPNFPHTPFGSSSGYIRAFCCPTTLQYDAPDYGFYLFDFLSATSFRWSMFAANPPPGVEASPLRSVTQREIDLSVAPSADEMKEQYVL